MKPIYLLPILSLILLVTTSGGNAASSSKKTAASSENTANSVLRVACDGNDVGAEVFINNKFKGECPLDIKIAEGAYKLRVLKTVDDWHEGIFEQDIRMGDGVAKKVEAVLSTRLSVAGQKREDQRLAAERVEVAKREARDRIEYDAALASAMVHTIFRDCPDCPDMVAIPPGSFDMGSKEFRETPVHRVSIGRAFAMGRTEVTQGQWQAIMGNNPSVFSKCGSTCPVEEVSWNDAQKFIQKLNAKTGKQYRLPSEAEWEYACRGGGQQEYCGSDNLGSVGWWYDIVGKIGNSGEVTHAVATKQANAFGLYDMSGNVSEWVEDSFHDNYNGAPADGSAWLDGGADRVLRGGKYWDGLYQCRASFRSAMDPKFPNLYGFRLARMLP